MMMMIVFVVVLKSNVNIYISIIYDDFDGCTNVN